MYGAVAAGEHAPSNTSRETPTSVAKRWIGSTLPVAFSWRSVGGFPRALLGTAGSSTPVISARVFCQSFGSVDSATSVSPAFKIIRNSASLGFSSGIPKRVPYVEIRVNSRNQMPHNHDSPWQKTNESGVEVCHVLPLISASRKYIA